MPLSNGITAMNKKWSEVEERFPEGKEHQILIFDAMEKLSSGVKIETCIEQLRLKTDNQRLIILFLHLATAYLDANL